MMLMHSNEDEYVCLNSMDPKMVENKFDIVMVYNLCEFEDEFLVRIFDCKSKRIDTNERKS